jgi:dTDP-4-dehydrorhamnose reductase
MRILITGGSGKLGKELKEIIKNGDFPSSEEFNVLNYNGMLSWIENYNKSFTTLLHCAAFTSPPLIDKEPLKALQVNVIGTANIVRLCIEKKIKLIYISTDYVFDGQKGMYKEKDPVNPVNKYAWSKLGGECAVRLYDNSLIIRLSFGPNIFPYEAAFKDQWTSRESVSISAKKIAGLVENDIRGIVHIGSKRRTVYEYAKSLDPKKEIKKISINDVGFTIPTDTSLNTDRYEKIIKR